jgi:hypothetical protein
MIDSIRFSESHTESAMALEANSLTTWRQVPQGGGGVSVGVQITMAVIDLAPLEMTGKIAFLSADWVMPQETLSTLTPIWILPVSSKMASATLNWLLGA